MLYVIVGPEVIGDVSLGDEIRPESHEAVAALHEIGLDGHDHRRRTSGCGSRG